MYEEISYEAVKQLFRDTEEPVLTAKDVADVFKVSRQAAKYRLDKLHERAEVGRMEVGSAAVVWWLDED
jgi:predicted ArsR family transcriptional regulator